MGTWKRNSKKAGAPTVLTSSKTTISAETKEGLRFLCKTDLFAFTKKVLNADRPGAVLTEGFHKPLCAYIQTTPYRKNLYLLPRGHFKTSLITVGRNIQRILQDPERCILIGSNKGENAEAMLAEIKGHLSSPLLIWLFPEILYEDPTRQAEQWTRAAIIVKRRRHPKEATIEAIGVTGELTSKHYDHGTFDDIVGKENSQTKDLREGIIQFLRVAESLFKPGSTQDMVGTPWHYADAWAWLLEQKEKLGMPLGTYIDPCWRIVPEGTEGAEFVAQFGWVQPRFPERFPVAELMAIRAFKGSAEFAAQYLLDPVSADTAVFPRDKVTIVQRRDCPPLEDLWICMTVDPAISTKSWADYSAIAVTGFDQTGELWVLDLRRGKWAESELVAQLYDAVARTPGIKAIGFEAIGFAKIYRRLFTQEGERRGVFLPIVTLERDTKITKAIRIRALQPLWEAGHVHILADVPALADFLEEAERFRVDRESAHDDMLDAVVDSLQLRGRPMAKDPAVPDYMLDDPEAIEKQQFTWALMKAKPWMDATSVRAAWSIHRAVRTMDQEAQAAALGIGPDEFFQEA